MSDVNVENILDQSLKILNQFEWLINSSVLDFYTEDHWSRLPLTWKSTLENLEPDILADLFKLKSNTSQDRIAWPLSLLCMRALLQKLSISRDSNSFDAKHNLQPEPMCYFHPKLKNLFRKRIKPKKQHEIERMAAIVATTAIDCRVEYILDFGAGLGHLSRVLGYGYGLNVCCLEQQKQLTDESKLFDEHLQRTACKFLEFEETKRLRRPVHLNIQLTESTDVGDLLDQIFECFGISNENRENFRFGIVGLHPCGDLAAVLLKVFLNCREAKFLNIVGCCYMKMTDSFSKNHSLCHLSYEAMEISCHSQEVYVKRLIEHNYIHLTVHAYRAAIEKIICKHWPNLKHAGLKSVKHSKGLTFPDYCLRATSHLNVAIPMSDVLGADVQMNLKCWKRVVIFYSLRLLLAPLVESVILYDRLLSVIENSQCVQLEAIFDPFISPRNHVMTATKKN